MNAETIQKLRAPFALADHTSNDEGFIYVAETAVTERLDDVDPAWAFEIVTILTRDKKVSVHARLTVCGVTRDNIGQQGVRYVKGTDIEVSEVEKGAATDALRRCARLFGVGRYLLGAPKVQKDAPKAWQNIPSWKPFTDWYSREFKTPQTDSPTSAIGANTQTPAKAGKTANSPTSAPPNGTPATRQPPTEPTYVDNPGGSITAIKKLTQADVITLQEKWHPKGVNTDEIMTALGVDRASLFEGDYADADQRVEEFHKQRTVTF